MYNRFEEKRKSFNMGFVHSAENYSITVKNGEVRELELEESRWHWSSRAQSIYVFLTNIALGNWVSPESFIKDIKDDYHTSEALDRAVDEYQNNPESLAPLVGILVGSDVTGEMTFARDWISSEVTGLVATTPFLSKILGIPEESVDEEMLKKAVDIGLYYVRVPQEWVSIVVNEIVDVVETELDFFGWEEFMRSVTRLKESHEVADLLFERIETAVFDGDIFELEEFQKKMNSSFLSEE